MFGRRSQRDFEDEVRSHLQLEIDRLKSLGMSEKDAEREARRHFGNVGMAGDRFYHAQPLVSLDEWQRDFRHALRGLMRTPSFLVTAVGTLALAIGAVAGMFDVVNTVMLRPLPFPQSDRLMFLMATAPGTDLKDTVGLGNEFYVHLKENSKLIDGIFSWSGGTSTFRVGDRAERIRMAWPTNDIYSVLRIRPQLGRLPTTDDRDHAVLLSDQLWSNWFNRDSSVIGKWYFVSDSMKQVIGVMPKTFIFPSDSTLLWVSSVEIRAADVRAGAFGTPLIVRIKDGVKAEQFAAEVRQLAQQVPARFGVARPAYLKIVSNLRPIVMPMLDGVLGPTLKTSLYILLGAVAVVLLIACANVANLFMVRGESRRRDITVRRAIGASRAQLIRFQMTEAFVVALIAGVIAVVLAAVTLPIFVRSAPEGINRLGDVRIDGATLATAFGLVVLVALACGAAPAIRGSAPDLTGLRSGGRGSIAGRQWSRELLVMGQAALALVLLIGSALLLQSFRHLRSVDAGYDVRGIYTFQFAPQQPKWNDGPTYGQLHNMMMDRFRALPGVTTVGVVNNIPLDEGTPGVRVLPQEAASGSDGAPVAFNFAGGDYFKAAGIRMVEGRPFTREEAITPNSSVILSQAAAAKIWPGDSRRVVGRQVRPRFGGQDTIAFTVVGVVNDVKQLDWRKPADAVMYLPLTGPTARIWAMGSPAYVIKSTHPELLKTEVRKIVHEVAPEAPVYREFTMEFLARRSMLELSFTTLTLGVLSALALILGAVGLYGTLSYVVAQRTREIGVRMALGATIRAVRSQIVAQGTKVIIVGAVIGVVVAFTMTRFLTRLLYDVKPADPIAFVLMSGIMIAIGLLASYVPARRASSVDPMEALRSD
ncbi:MAG TPA: ABC transporter permease [Gemmatimonadaceae bacterium]|jgi:predicted permease